MRFIYLYYTLLLIIIIINLFNQCYGQKRILKSELNPDCKSENECQNSTLLHIESIGLSNTYHYLWCFITNFVPTIFVFDSDIDAKLVVNWNNDDEIVKFKFENGSVHNSFAMELSNLNFINTTINEKTKVASNENLYTIPMKDVHWQFENNTYADSFRYIFENANNSQINGTLRIVLSIFDQAGRDDSIPRLQYTQSSNILDLTLDNIYFILPYNTEQYTQTQLVANITFVYEGQTITSNLNQTKTIDDEYTPGVFHVC